MQTENVQYLRLYADTPQQERNEIKVHSFPHTDTGAQLVVGVDVLDRDSGQTYFLPGGLIEAIIDSIRQDSLGYTAPDRLAQ